HKIEDDIVDEQLQKLEEQSTKAEDNDNNYKPLKDAVEFGDFMNMDIRAGKIIEAGKIEKSNKLLKIKVDLGFEQRIIVSGIANDFEADALPGQRVCVLANLEPKKLMGIESNGMILMAEEADGSLKFVETEAVPGSPVM
ncbi:MAG: methionine--tRNA ligase subunit beta, partial [Balneolaceae bacterium]|nr:methionine--tRNA ligase subunit beta [Balneolaceae bacterium]